ncbi:hypothetical protein [Aeoliella mucimassa]|uniref:Leucine Rich repeats (2 copies) n=1 Tax=Aeoliella mucimassa TaxID=2527972 RepID=A0A518AJW7_9BACT|nr:hypothetical protein [Aeoliella mucimassa]QDU55020.1 hypothetical protein Pan181_12050 [Aeoliella mucimassa]
MTLDRDEIDNLQPLGDLAQIESLALMNYVSPETDWSCLTELKHLKKLHLGYTGLDTEAIKRLKETLPECEVIEH